MLTLLKAFQTKAKQPAKRCELCDRRCNDKPVCADHIETLPYPQRVIAELQSGKADEQDAALFLTQEVRPTFLGLARFLNQKNQARLKLLLRKLGYRTRRVGRNILVVKV